ncbi:MAG: FtsX-like permease family protein [Bacteroidales bacterium]
MHFPLFVAKRYFLTRKLRNVINIISIISVIGVAVGTMALVVVLSVFNGFDELIKSTYSTFDPDLKIEPKIGKMFNPGEEEGFEKLREMESIAVFTEVLEEDALVRYDEKQYIGRIKGVENNFADLTEIDKRIVNGEFALHEDGKERAVVGQGVAYYLSVSVNYTEPLNIYVPKRGQSGTFNPEQAFNREYIYPSGIFSIQQEYDVEYILVPLEFARDLLDYDQEVTAVELKIKEGYDINKTRNEIREILGDNFEIKNRSEQHAMLNKVMKSEKLSIFVILTFILIVASFNIIGSLTMLIIDKKNDMLIFRSLGANFSTVKRIFFFEGWMISIVGSVIGVIIGVFISWLQETFGLIQLNESGSFMIDHYPVNVHIPDVLLIFFTVLAIGFFASYLPVKYIIRKYIFSNSRETML